jgi:hypothetical protein
MPHSRRGIKYLIWVRPNMDNATTNKLMMVISVTVAKEHLREE